MLERDENDNLLGFPSPTVNFLWEVYDPEAKSLVVAAPFSAFWDGAKITVEPGYESDGASIPRILWTLVGHPFGDYMPAALIHDVLYDSKTWERGEADKCLRDLISVLPVSAWRRQLIYWGVRAGGGVPWKKYTAEHVAKNQEFITVEYQNV